MSTTVVGDVNVEIDESARRVISRWDDGTELVASPAYDAENVARAQALGYTGDDPVWQMTRDHDLLHHVVAVAAGELSSRHLWRVAHGERSNGALEERMVLLMQRFGNVGLRGCL